MALVQYGSLVTGLRGKLGGHVFQYNSKGSFIRTNAIPRLNNTSRGNLVRNNMSLVAALWQSMTGTRKQLWADECSSYTFYNKYGVAFTPNAYQLFTYAQLQFASLGLSIIDTIPAGGTVANIVSYITDVDISAEDFRLGFTSAPDGPYYAVIRVSRLSNTGNELTGLPLNFLRYIHSSSMGPFNIYANLVAYFGSGFVAGKSFKMTIETIRYSGFAPGAIYSQIINILP